MGSFAMQHTSEPLVCVFVVPTREKKVLSLADYCLYVSVHPLRTALQGERKRVICACALTCGLVRAAFYLVRMCRADIEAPGEAVEISGRGRKLFCFEHEDVIGKACLFFPPSVQNQPCKSCEVSVRIVTLHPKRRVQNPSDKNYGGTEHFPRRNRFQYCVDEKGKQRMDRDVHFTAPIA